MQIEIFENKEELVKKANEESIKGDAKFKELIYLYFIARYFVSLYEAKFGLVPMQVWNEYRNSLDHFFRDLTNSGNNHINKMQGHLQRAVLDILKIYCHSIQDKVKLLREDFDVKALKLVDNGDFLKILTQDVKKAEDSFIKAKIKDSSLGDDSYANKEIIGKYLDAVFSFDAVYRFIIDKNPKIENAKETYTAISSDAAKGSFKEHMKTHYIFYLSWTLIATPLANWANSAYLQQVVEYVKSLF